MNWDFKNFGRSEFVDKLDGSLPEIAEIHYWGIVAYFLQPMRTHIKKPIYIHSGYRTIEHNNNTPNSDRNSYHTLGINPTIYHPCAVDFWTDLTVDDVETYIDYHTATDFCGYHVYTNKEELWFIHIDWRGSKARW